MDDRMGFTGRTAVVTGAGRGLGRAFALALADRGANVVVNDLGTSLTGEGADGRVAQQVVDEISAAGGQAVSSTATIATPEGAHAIISLAVEAFGAIDIVVNNAGILSTTFLPDSDLPELQRILTVDPCGHFNVCRAAWPHLVQQRSGRIVICTSAAAFGGGAGLSYAVGKAATFGLARVLAPLGEPHGIRINALAPFAFTRMADRLSPAQVAVRQRLAPPEQVSAAVLFLAHESCTLSGECVVAGAGRVSRVFLAESPGLYDPEVTPEVIRDNWETLSTERDATVVADGNSFISSFYGKVPGWSDALAAS